jgi:hypothetical protein
MELIIQENQKNLLQHHLIEMIKLVSVGSQNATSEASKEEQKQLIENQFNTLWKYSKELPLLAVNLVTSTEYSKQLAIVQALRNPLESRNLIIHPRDWAMLENHLLAKTLRQLPITYVLRLIDYLYKKEAKNKNQRQKKVPKIQSQVINNRRAYNLILNYLLNLENFEFIALKYRNKLKRLFTHCWNSKKSHVLIQKIIQFQEQKIWIDSEDLLKELIYRYNPNFKDFALLLFIFNCEKEEYFSSNYPLIQAFFEAKKDILSVKNVPDVILFGLVNNPQHSQYQSLWSTKELRASTMKLIRESNQVTTENQKIRQTKQNQELKAEVKVNIEKVTDWQALYKTIYENGFDEKLFEQAQKLAPVIEVYYDNIGIIWDKSKSTEGTDDAKWTCKAILEHTFYSLAKSVEQHTLVECTEFTTQLGKAFIKLVQEKPNLNAIFILTDGYENVYHGLLEEVVTIYKKHFRNIPVFMINPQVNKVNNRFQSISVIHARSPEAIGNQLQVELLNQDFIKYLELNLPKLLN